MEERFAQVFGETAAEVLGEMLTEESLRAKVRRKPGGRRRGKIEDHMVHHVVCRSWCPHCVKGRGVSHGHRARPASGKTVSPELHMDYTFMNEQGEGVPILMTRGRDSGMMFASVVPAKGVGKYVVRRRPRT